MYNIAYIFMGKIDRNNGVSRKVLSQIKSFQNYNSKVDLFCLDNTKKLLPNVFPQSLNFFWNLIIEKKQDENDIIYLRHVIFTPFVYAFLKKNKNKKIFMEIPTYPYEGEIKNNKLKFYFDRKYRKKISDYVDYIVTFSEDKEIWGIPCINISNGIDLETTKLVNKVQDEVLTFTSVSICAPWHGIDRFLNSLEQFKLQNPDVAVKFNIVGEGSETPKLKAIVENSQYLKDVVVFHGFRSGQELDDIYNETNIGVGCLANYRKGIYTIQALKNKEYAAKGLPMIFSEDDPGLRGKEYVYRASHNEEIIDIADVISWYYKLTITPEEIRESITEFSWDNQMKKIIDIIEKAE